MAAISGSTDQSTMINQLPNNPESNNNNDSSFVNNILNQMDNDNAESDNNYRETQDSYQQQQFAVDQQQIDQQNQQQMMQQQMMEQQQQMMDQQQHQQQMMNDNYSSEPQVEEKKSILMKIKEYVKNPLIFLAVFVLLTLPFVRKFILTQVQRLTVNAGLQLWATTIISGILGAIIFGTASHFI